LIRRVLFRRDGGEIIRAPDIRFHARDVELHNRALAAERLDDARTLRGGGDFLIVQRNAGGHLVLRALPDVG